MKQQHHERQLSLKVMEKVDSMKKKEKELIKEGKRPFFLKNSEKKNIMAEERYE
jgi:ribosomal RNA-processing protein 36